MFHVSRFKFHDCQGFTLMELLIVIALIGILVTMGVASYQTAQIKSRDSRRQADMKTIQNAFEQFYADHNSVYPVAADVPPNMGPYLPAGMPTDPKPSQSYTTDYQVSGNPYYYCACAKIEGSTGSNADSTQCGNFGRSCIGANCYYCVRNLQ